MERFAPLEFQRLVVVLIGEVAARLVDVDAQPLLLGEQVDVVTRLVGQCVGLPATEPKQIGAVADVRSNHEELVGETVLAGFLNEIFRLVKC
jgi:hypothetical protein